MIENLLQSLAGRRILLAATIATLACASHAEEGYFGAAQININPATPIRLSGHASRYGLPEATDIQLDLFAQAAAFGTGPETSLLITVDSTNIPRALADAVKSALVTNHGLAKERIVIASTHSHSAPHVNRPSSQFDPTVRPITSTEQQHIDQYTNLLISRLEQVANEALGNRSPGHQISWGQGTVGFGLNRRGTPDAPNDHDLPVMRVTDIDGTVRAILTSYATHGTTLDPSDNLISGDWPGYAREAIMEAYPGVVPLVMLGAAGDSNPTPRGTLEHAQNYGQQVADEIQHLINNNLLTPVSGQITAVHGEVDLAFATQREPNDPLNARLAPAPASHRYGITSWTFGDNLAMVFFEGELTVDYSLRLKSELDETRLWVNGYSNDVRGYIPSERILYEGGYEADDSTYWYDLPGRFAHGLEDKIMAEAHRQLRPFYFPSDRLQLIIQWNTGALVIHNPTDEPISLDAYTITSREGRFDLNPGQWNSLEDQFPGGWEKAGNVSPSRLTEFNPNGQTTLQPGESLPLGTPFSAAAPTAFGVLPNVANDLQFTYASLAKGSRHGLLRQEGPYNNLVLTIDPRSGKAILQNDSPFFDVAIDGYTIESNSGRLSPEDWTSLHDQQSDGWDEADNNGPFRIAEFNPTGASFLPKAGTALHLGSLVDVAGAPLTADEFRFEFAMEGGGTLQGVVIIAMFDEPGDFNRDGTVDVADYQLWRHSFGQTMSLGEGADGNGDGRIDAADYVIWRSHFVSTAGGALVVPEPASVMLLNAVLGWWCASHRASYESRPATADASARIKLDSMPSEVASSRNTRDARPLSAPVQ